MNDFKPIKPKLFKTVANLITKDFPGFNKFKVRQAVIEAYMRCGGDFELPKQKVTASLRTKSGSHMWRQYLGDGVVLSTELDNKIILQRNQSFGFRPTATGYNIVIADLASKPLNVSLLQGNTLLSFSRPLSTRETKFKQW